MAQIEIMSLDLPRVEYLDNEKRQGNSNTKKKNTGVDYEAVRKNEEALKENLDRRKKNEWQKIKLSELDTNTQTNTDTHG